MTAAAFLTDLRQRGVRVWADGDRLRYSAPRGTVTDDVRRELETLKPRLLELLRGGGTAGGVADDAVIATPTARTAAPDRKISLTGNERLAPLSIDELPQHPHPYARYVAPYRSALYGHLGLDKRFVRGEGCYLFDEHGDRYLDMVAQFGALPFGSNPPAIWRALIEVRDRGAPSFVNPALMDVAGELAERLVRVAPPGLRHVTFANSGTEAVEVALKLARSATGRNGILSTSNAFHGLTLGSMSATGREVFQKGFGAPVPGFDRVAYGDAEALKSALSARPGYYAGFIIEPIQGEGGIVEPPAGYLHAVQHACREAGVVLVMDEVQTGLGRTGSMFACERPDGLGASQAAMAPDVLVLAKALGGGLVPIGACLYTDEVYNTTFELWHSSTFAGNTLACRAGVAALDLLEADDRRLIRHVAESGEFLRKELDGIRTRFPRLLRQIRGRGYMLGVELGLDGESLGCDLLVHLAGQRLLLHLIVSYLLNVERVRVAPAYTGASVLRIEPPLIAGRDECLSLVKALERLFEHLQAGDVGALMRHLVVKGQAQPVPNEPDARSANRRRSGRDRRRAHDVPGATRFAFLMHLLSSRDYADFDESLAEFSDAQLADLHQRMSRFVDPFPVGTISVQSPAGGKAVGELVLIPHTAEELMLLPADRALGEVRRAAEIAYARGAGIVGLGGFTSVVTQGGMAMTGPGLPRLTNGNSYTVAMAKRGVELACLERGVDLAAATVAVVGAGGIIGRATVLLMAQHAGRIILVGNPALPQRSEARLKEIAREALEPIREPAGDRRTFAAGTLARRVTELDAGLGDPLGQLAADDRLVVTTDFDAMLPQAEVVISATNSIDTLIFERHLKENAIVCDVSRPFNVCRDIRRTRPDVMLIDGGTVEVAGEADLTALGGAHERYVPACVGETILLAFENADDLPGLFGTLRLDTIQRVEEFGRKHGFEVVLKGDTWDLGDTSHL